MPRPLAVLSSPFVLGPFELPHRVVMAPLTRSRAGEERVANLLMAEHYAQRAAAALIVSEGAQISEQAIGYPATPGIHTEAQVAGWRLVTDAVHAAGGRIFCQLWHVGRVSLPEFQPGGALPVAPSAIAAPGEGRTMHGPVPYPVPRALETAELPGIVAQYAHAAGCARRAGFDGVEIHGANGYLLDQFLRDGTNRRTDAYGGPVENRARLLLEVADAVVAVWGAERVGVRLRPRYPSPAMSDSDPLATYTYAARELGRRRVAFLHVVEGMSGPTHVAGSRVTPAMRAAFGGAVVLAGGYTRETAELAVASGECDLVAFGVPFIANPDLPRRLFTGAPLATADPATFYTPGPKGYTDYPALAW